MFWLPLDGSHKGSVKIGSIYYVIEMMLLKNVYSPEAEAHIWGEVCNLW